MLIRYILSVFIMIVYWLQFARNRQKQQLHFQKEVTECTIYTWLVWAQWRKGFTCLLSVKENKIKCLVNGFFLFFSFFPFFIGTSQMSEECTLQSNWMKLWSTNPRMPTLSYWICLVHLKTSVVMNTVSFFNSLI